VANAQTKLQPSPFAVLHAVLTRPQVLLLMQLSKGIKDINSKVK
jgi:hypothetical protein